MATKAGSGGDSPRTRMLRTEKRSLTVTLPQLPRNIINEMVYKRTKPRYRDPVKSLPEKEVLEQRKHHKRIFTEGISEISRLNFYDFSLDRENFNPSNLPDHANYYKSKKGKQVHLMAWYGKRQKLVSKSPENKEKGPQYGYYKQGIPGETSLTLPSLFMPAERGRNGVNVRFAEGLTPREDREKSILQTRMPPNTPNVPQIANKKLSLGLESKSDSSLMKTEDTQDVHRNGESTQRSKESPRVAQITLGAELPMLLNYEARQRRELRNIYPMFDSLETAKENVPKLTPVKTQKPRRIDEDLKVARMHTQTLQFMMPGQETPRGEPRSKPGTSRVGPEEHKAIGDTIMDSVAVKKDAIVVPQPPPPSADGARTEAKTDSNNEPPAAEVNPVEEQETGNNETETGGNIETETGDNTAVETENNEMKADDADNAADLEVVTAETEDSKELHQEEPVNDDVGVNENNNNNNNNNSNNAGSDQELEQAGTQEPVAQRPAISRRTSTRLEVPAASTMDLERPPSSVCESTEELNVNEARVDINTPEIHISDEPNQ